MRVVRSLSTDIIWIKHTPQTDITKMYLDSERVTGLVSLILTNYRAIFQVRAIPYPCV